MSSYTYIYFFVQFKKREKHPWRSDTFKSKRLKPATLLNVILPCGCFSGYFSFVIDNA